MAEYEATIGIECHVQLKTKTKLFAGVDNDARDAAPNSKVSPICFGMPGVLPVLNREAVNIAIRAGLALNAEVAHFSKFDRKHYFYPDLPKGYQITQFDQPTVGKGSIEITVDGQTKTIGITRAHLEEDAGKSTHPAGKDYSLVDLNRAGTPLLEIVSEPDMHTPAEARAYVQELYYLMKYADVSDVDLFHGNMRFDVNLSVAPKGSNTLGTRSEVKNLNSFRSVEKAAAYEFKRQVELLEKGQTVVQETRGWDDTKMRTFSQRSKEEAHDYRYFPEPDIPPIVIEPAEIEAVRQAMPLLPPEIRAKLLAAGVELSQIQTLLDNEASVEKVLLAIDEQADTKRLKKYVNWLTGEIQALRSNGQAVDKLTYSHLQELGDLVDEGLLSSTAAKEVLAIIASDGGSAKDVAESKQLIQSSDSGEIEALVDQVISENAAAAEDVRNGETKAIGFLVGQVMKISQGKANPPMVKALLEKKLSAKQ